MTVNAAALQCTRARRAIFSKEANKQRLESAAKARLRHGDALRIWQFAKETFEADELRNILEVQL